MDGKRFDELSRAFAHGRTRRGVLKGLAGGLAAGVAALTGRGSTAAQRLPNGTACTRATQCASFKCADGVCCDSQCTGQCEACDLQGSLGTCTPLPAGTQQWGNRPACTGTDVCQASCDGVETRFCTQYPGFDISCAPGECSSGWGITYGCGGDGTCHPLGESCGLYVCDAAGVACLTSCTTDDDCVEDAVCDVATGACRDKLPLGEDCTADAQCQSGICAQGVCCVEACPGGCQVCNAPGNEGFCAPAPDDTSCGLDDLCCDGACIDVQIDLEHCGQCDNACRLAPTPGSCEAEPVCNQGTCTFTTLPDNAICGPVNDDRCCGGLCIDVQIDETHCGFCGNTCAAPTPFCLGGNCVECLAHTDCSPTELCNNGTCVPEGIDLRGIGGPLTVDDDIRIIVNGVTVVDDNDGLITVYQPFNLMLTNGDSLCVAADNVVAGRRRITPYQLVRPSDGAVQVLDPVGFDTLEAPVEPTVPAVIGEFYSMCFTVALPPRT